MFKNKKGQAAITDALFFLLIVVTISVLMFRYSSTYGQKIEKATTDLYFKDYTNSVLRTVFYTSVPLDFSLNIKDAKESDYLIAQIKQNFYAEGKIGSTDVNNLGTEDYRDLAKYNLYHTIKATMFPLKSQDYMFYIYEQKRSVGQEDEFYFFMIKLTNYHCDTPTVTGKTNCILNPGETESYYLCNPKGGYSEIRNIVSKTPNIFSSSVPLNFLKYAPNFQSSAEISTIATFAIWTSTIDINEGSLSTINCKKV